LFAPDFNLFGLTNTQGWFIIADMSSFWRTLDRAALRDIALVCFADAVVGASFGAISVAGGLPPWVPVIMSLLVFAGGAQFAAVGVVLAGGSPAAAVVAGLLLNARLLPYGFAVSGVVSGGWWTRLLGAHVIVDESVAFALRQRDWQLRRAVFWVCGVALFVCWNLAVGLGALAGTAISDTSALGLDAAFPTVLLALVLPSLRDRHTRNAALLGGAVAVASTPFLPVGLPLLVALAGLMLAGWTGTAPARASASANSEPADSASTRTTQPDSASPTASATADSTAEVS
jgi:4-azaleucine resistance transporter AzlC